MCCVIVRICSGAAIAPAKEACSDSPQEPTDLLHNWAIMFGSGMQAPTVYTSLDQSPDASHECIAYVY